MSFMFGNAFVFNQDINSWTVPGVTVCSGFSSGANATWETTDKPNFTSCAA